MNESDPPEEGPVESTQERQVSTKAEVATALGVSEKTVRRRIADGSIRAIRLGRAVRVPNVEVERLLNG